MHKLNVIVALRRRALTIHVESGGVCCAAEPVGGLTRDPAAVRRQRRRHVHVTDDVIVDADILTNQAPGEMQPICNQRQLSCYVQLQVASLLTV